MDWTKLLNPKTWIYIVATALLVFAGWKVVGFIYDLGYDSRNTEVTKLEKERDNAVADYNTYRAEYLDWVANTRDAQHNALKDQIEINRQLNEKLRLAREAAANKPTTIKEVIRYVPAEVDASYPLPSGFIRLYVESLQGKTATDAAYGDFSRSDTFDVGKASPITLSQFGLIASRNNAECVVRGAVIESWQEWYLRAKASYERNTQIIWDTAPVPRK